MAMDPRSGGNGRGVVGIKNRYSMALQGAWEQSQCAFVLRSMFMRAVASSSSDPAMGYIIMGCAIYWATSSGSRHGSSSCSNSFCVAPLYMQVWESGALRGGQSLHPWRSSYRRGSVIIIIIGGAWTLAFSFFLVGYGFFFYYDGKDSFDSSSPIRNVVSCFRSFSIHSLHPLWHHIFNDVLHTIWISSLQKFLMSILATFSSTPI